MQSKHRIAIILTNYHVLTRTRHFLHVVADVFAVSAACIKKNRVVERLNERINRLEEFGCGLSEIRSDSLVRLRKTNNP